MITRRDDDNGKIRPGESTLTPRSRRLLLAFSLTLIALIFWLRAASSSSAAAAAAAAARALEDPDSPASQQRAVAGRLRARLEARILRGDRRNAQANTAAAAAALPPRSPHAPDVDHDHDRDHPNRPAALASQPPLDPPSPTPTYPLYSTSLRHHLGLHLASLTRTPSWY